MPKTGAYAILHDFQGSPTDGASPYATMLNDGGTLFGTTVYNSSSGDGVLFSLDPTGNAYNVLHFFQGGNDGASSYSHLIKVDGRLAGTTQEGGPANQGTVFSYYPKNGRYQVVYAFQGGSDAGHPSAGLLKLGTLLYGTSSSGGAFGYGAIFSLDPQSGAEQVVHSFQGPPNDGEQPLAGLIAVGGTLYGTTQLCGSSTACTTGCGTVFAFQP